MSERIIGTVEKGESNASKWLALFQAEYQRKLGMSIFPGSLNLRVDHAFDWQKRDYQEHLIRFAMEEYGGERDILLLPCVLIEFGRRAGFLWYSIHPETGVGTANVLEVLTDIKLRDQFGLSDGDRVELEILG